MLSRDAARFADARRRINRCPLGSGALAGSTLPLDRALWTSGSMPEPEDPLYDRATPRFENPNRVCVSPLQRQMQQPKTSCVITVGTLK